MNRADMLTDDECRKIVAALAGIEIVKAIDLHNGPNKGRTLITLQGYVPGGIVAALRKLRSMPSSGKT